jgi:hypothetical protein
MKKGV